jgi:hypothetical protein
MLPSDNPLLDSIEIELREQGSWRKPGDELWVGSASAGGRRPRLAVVDDWDSRRQRRRPDQPKGRRRFREADDA